MTWQKTIEITTKGKEQFLDITKLVNNYLAQTGVDKGLCHVYSPHTTAGLVINEGADPSVTRDILTHLVKLVPAEGDYTHLEGNSPAHIKSLLTGAEKTIPIANGKLLLGTWQKLFFGEFDGPRSRKFIVTVITDETH